MDVWKLILPFPVVGGMLTEDPVEFTAVLLIFLSAMTLFWTDVCWRAE